jgi:FkbH-like protein
MELTSELRYAVHRAIESGSYERAATLLSRLMREQPTASNAHYVVKRFTEIGSHLQLTQCRLAVLRSFTVEPVIPFLQARCFAAGIDATVHVGGFNSYAQELLDPDSALYHFEPDLVILAVRTPDVVPALWCQFAELAEEEVDRIVEVTLRDFKHWIEAFRSRSKAHLILHDLESPAYLSRGVWDAQGVSGQKEAIQRLNQGLHQLAQQQPGVYLLDYDGLIARHGRLGWHDEPKWLTMRMPIAADCLIHLTDEYMRFIHPLTGKVRKALVVDLDNTLWGGIVGEDELQGIQLGLEYPGAAFHALQRVILDLYQRGVILAICSKNNLADALEVLENHPHMLLRSKHFAAVHINWDDKVENLRRIAAELNIGLDALAFLDDSPVERESVCSRLPEVYVIDLPGDPMAYAKTLRECPVFERLVLSEEDKRRGRYYAEQRQRTELQQGARSLEEFYYALQMRIEIAEASPSTLPRIAQLTQKTNQFNLTTHSYTEQELAQMLQDPHTCIFSVRLTDRFGDNGIMGVAILSIHGDSCEIDTLLLSCRVMGRTAETAMLACLAEEARRQGAKEIMGWYLPTKKNAPARDFYAKHGFTQVIEKEGSSLWKFDLRRDQIVAPPWIQCKYIKIADVLR